jgi:hypothetical protein
MVLRDGVKRSISAADLVVGDVIVLAAGDRVSADGLVLQAEDLALDTSILTGESVPAAAPRPGSARGYARGSRGRARGGDRNGAADSPGFNRSAYRYGSKAPSAVGTRARPSGSHRGTCGRRRGRSLLSDRAPPRLVAARRIPARDRRDRGACARRAVADGDASLPPALSAWPGTRRWSANSTP